MDDWASLEVVEISGTKTSMMENNTCHCSAVKIWPGGGSGMGEGREARLGNPCGSDIVVLDAESNKDEHSLVKIIWAAIPHEEQEFVRGGRRISEYSQDQAELWQSQPS